MGHHVSPVTSIGESTLQRGASLYSVRILQLYGASLLVHKRANQNFIIDLQLNHSAAKILPKKKEKKESKRKQSVHEVEHASVME